MSAVADAYKLVCLLHVSIFPLKIHEYLLRWLSLTHILSLPLSLSLSLSLSLYIYICIYVCVYNVCIRIKVRVYMCVYVAACA